MKSAPLFSVGIVFHEQENMLPRAISSLLQQSFPHFELLLRDQSPSGSASEWLQKRIPKEMEDSRIRLFQGENLFHSGGHNALIHKMCGTAYCCASNDMEYDNRLLEVFANSLQAHPEVDIFVPKLFRWEKGRIQKIDSCGIGLTKSNFFFDIGHEMPDSEQYNIQREVFGGSGALFCVRKDALESIRNGSEYFDELLHYKNDVDLMYRFQWLGKKSLFLPEAIAWHARHARKNGKKSVFIKESSLFGQIVLLRKHVWKKLPFSVQIFSGIRILLVLMVLLVTSPKILFRVFTVLKTKEKEIRKKTALISKTVPPEQICSFFERI
ncbi:glycosyltransferase family 2 protein [Candidatus Peregrinibacteria bacterium]|nr:MAG: glycosyltransferase family 2 protein [Candidatus Peregrinibacteria bacterium]